MSSYPKIASKFNTKASAGHEQFVEFLLSTPNTGKSPADANQNEPTAAIIDINAVNETGQTALHYACSKGRTEVRAHCIFCISRINI